MEGEAAAAVLQVLVQNLIDLSKKEISLIRGLDKEASNLTGNLDTIQKFLNDAAETRSIHGEAVKSWLRKLEDAAFDADNVLDELNYHLLSKKLKTLKPINEKVLSCFPSFNRVARPRKMALRIKETNENLDSLKKEATELQLVERLAAGEPSFLDAAFETASFTFDPIFIGRDDDVSQLVEMLTASCGATAVEPAIFAIVGMGGMGKTTLTRKIFNSLEEEGRFGSCIWVHVSQVFDPITLFKKVLRELISDDQVQVESKQDVLKKLQEALKDKAYLLVLDDVWNRDLPKWEDFINSLLGVTSTEGNAIVVTTRNMDVASMVNPFHTYELEGLSEEDCWSIIKEKAFRKEEGDVPSEIETIGRKIARRCQGLPLAANVVGGILRNKSEEKWLETEQKWLSRDEGNDIVRILRLSYDNLSPASLKKCFAYCSIFPKGHEIRKQQLIEYWMAEGFLQADTSNESMELLGGKFADVLLHNSLLQAGDRDEYGNVESCVMHDLVHDVASSVLGISDNADGLRRVRYMNYCPSDEQSFIPKEMAKHVRTLFFEGEFSSTIFSDFEGLHVLVLDSYLVEELPNSIRKLIHLRNLTLSRSTEIKRLPEWIGELHHLQTLRAETEDLSKLPSSIKYLINLRHLYVTWRTELPAEIGRLTSLQTLRHFTVGNGKGFKIDELGSLNNLKGELDISNLERVGSKEEAEKANLFKKSKLLELCLRWDRTKERKRNNEEDVLEGLQPHPNLKKLLIDGFKGTRFPSWTMKMEVGNVGLNKLIEISLWACSECEEIPMLGHLPYLKSLELHGLSHVKCIGSSFYGLVSTELTTRTVFAALERLEMVDMPELAEWEEVRVESGSEAKVFPRLQHLKVYGCERLMRVPSHFSPCLKYLLVEKSGLEYLPDRLFIDNPNLSELNVEDCPKLRELPQGLCTLSSLKIKDCPCLERIADDPRGEGSLRRLDILHCDALSYLPCELLGSSLQGLRLLRLPSLKNLPSLIGSLHRSPHLTDLTVVDVPNFLASSSSSRVEICPTFHSLTDIDINVSTEGSSSGSMEAVDGILRGCCHSLERLGLIGMETWECLPGSMQLLEALSLLNLENIGMEELPEWFGKLSSLEQLSLCNCKKLRRLPSVDAMRRLAALEWLTIEGCPELRIEKQGQQQSRDEGGDSEWTKVSHVLNITIDGLRVQSMYDYD